MSALRHLTFRRSPDGFVEDELLRGLHPLMAARLRLSRLRNFTIERLPAADDVYLFHAPRRDNPDDERLFALAEVRDLTAVRDDERSRRRAAATRAGAPRGARRHPPIPSARPPERRLQWNRVVLHVWPPLLLGLDEVRDGGPPPRPGDRGTRPRADRRALPPSRPRHG